MAQKAKLTVGCVEDNTDSPGQPLTICFLRACRIPGTKHVCDDELAFFPWLLRPSLILHTARNSYPLSNARIVLAVLK